MHICLAVGQSGFRPSLCTPKRQEVERECAFPMCLQMGVRSLSPD